VRKKYSTATYNSAHVGVLQETEIELFSSRQQRVDYTIKEQGQMLMSAEGNSRELSDRDMKKYIM